jgi:cyanophycin synthetase
MNLIEPIHQHAHSRPNEPAVITPREKISWSRLDRMIWSMALRLSENGLTGGDRVGIAMANPVIHLITSLALARIGVAHIAIPLSESDIVRNGVVEKLALKRILTDTPKMASIYPNGMLLNQLAVKEVSEEQKQKLESTNGQLVWLILQTSGTTGNPKFAELTHATAHERVMRFLPLFNSEEGDIFWAASRPDFAVAKQRLTFSLIAGAAICLPAVNKILPELLDFLNQQRITLACGTPSHLHQLIGVGKPIPSLRAFEARSAFINEKLRRDFKSKINDNLYVVYGTNEGDALSLADPVLQASVPNTVGVATHSMVIEVVDRCDVPLPSLITGEIRIRGPGLVTSYLNDSEASEKAFKNGWFYPGDLGYFTKEGSLVLQGRKDDMMIFDGMNIYPAEIENVLSSHPAVDEVAAFSVKHERFQDVPVAAVTLKATVAEKDLVEFCKTPLGVKHPKRVFILKDFPRNQMGKILRRELLSMVSKNRD